MIAKQGSRRNSVGWARAMVAAALLLVGGCGAKPSAGRSGQGSPATTQATTQQGQTGLPTTTMKIGSWIFNLEIARTPKELEIGLMDRDSMPANHGMIFVFDTPRQLHFWMKDTHIPLDVIFVTGDGTVDSVQPMKAFDVTTDTRSRGLAQYAIELNLGAADIAGVRPGDHLDIPPAARAK